MGDWADDGREKANKQGKRTSWSVPKLYPFLPPPVEFNPLMRNDVNRMGWFNRGTANPDDRPVTTDVVFEGKDVE